MKLSEDLQARHLVQHHTFEPFDWIDEPQTFYLGVDASADSLTIGNLVAFLVARRLADAGWKPILLMGGATSLIGDPGGKDEERALKPREEIVANVAGIRAQVEKLFAGKDFEIVDNYDWFKDMGYLDFLREVGKHFSMADMVSREYVRERMGEGGSGISYAEFSYSLIQGYDFWHLFRTKGAVLQIGGSDQWGNMVAGLPLIRKKEAREAHALSIPLLVNKATGKKFGKSEEGAVWLDLQKTSPFSFYQFLFNSEDEAVEEYLLALTLVPVDEIGTIMESHRTNPAARTAQKRLAHEVTALVHDEHEAARAEQVSALLFGEGDLASLSDEARQMLITSAPTVEVAAGLSIIDTLVASDLASSKREARQFLTDGAISLNDIKVDESYVIVAEDFKNGLALLRRGKRNVCVLRLQ